MFGGKAHTGGVCGEDGGVGDEGHTCRFSGFDDVGVLSNSLPHLGSGHEQELVDAVECDLQSVAIAVLGDAHLDAARCQHLRLGGISHDCHDLTGGDAALDEPVDDESAEMPCCTCYCCGHVIS